MSPFELDEIAFDKVIDIYAELRTLQIRKKKEKPDEKKEKVIRRPAGDDWF